MKATEDQVVALAEMEQLHHGVRRMPEGHPLGESILENSFTGTRIYFCMDCGLVFTIEPDGTRHGWCIEERLA